MGWGGKGKGPKGPWPLGPPHHHHHHHGPNPLVVAAEAAVVGGVAAAAVATVAARPRPRRPPIVLPPQQVVVVGSTQAPVVAVPAPPPQPVYVSEGVVVRGAAALPPPKGKGKGKGKGKAAVVVQQELLDVTNVRLPPAAMELRGSVNFFAVDVTHLNGETWRVMRRYNDFHSLHDRLGSQSFPGAPFPRKHYMGCTGQKLEDRRQGLEMWLQRALENPASGGAWLQPLKQFLEAGRCAITAGASAPSLPAATPAIALAPAPASAPAPAASPPLTEPSSSEEEVMLEICIPAGVSAGQLLGVNVPNGQQLTVAVPEGLSAGATLELLYDPRSNTLTPLT